MRRLTKKGAVSREALLGSARRSFRRWGYDAGVRDITAGAGMTAMMVQRYFNTKEQLFEEVVDTVFAILARDVLKDTPDVPALCRSIAIALVEDDFESYATPTDGILIMLRSVNNALATPALLRKFETHCAPFLSEVLPRSSAAQRAVTFLSVIAGFEAMERIAGMTAFAEAEPEEIAQRLEALFGTMATRDTHAY